MGGSEWDDLHGVVEDNLSNIYVSGETKSQDFPVTPGAYNQTRAGFTDGFVSKLDQNCSTLLFSTFIGAEDNDVGKVIKVDELYNVYVAGTTTSHLFPTTEGVFQRNLKGIVDCFITKLNSTGTALIFSTYLGGTDDDFITSIDLDLTGSFFVSGLATSSDFPITSNALRKTFQQWEGFLCMLTSNASEIIYSTFIGGNSFEEITSCEKDKNNNFYFVGYTSSSDFPITPDAYQKSQKGDDFFITKFNFNQNKIEYSTFLGGWGRDIVNDIFVDTLGNACVIGETNQENFPTTPGAYRRTMRGWIDGFVSILNPQGTKLLYSTFMDAEVYLSPNSVFVNPNGTIVVVSNNNFYSMSLKNGNKKSDQDDIIITQFNSKLNDVIFSDRLGMAQEEHSYNTFFKNSGSMTTIGVAYKGDTLTPGVYQPIMNGNDDGFIAKYQLPQVYLQLTSPNGFDDFKVGSVKTITWDEGGISTVKIQYSTNNGTDWITIVDNYPGSSGTYNWTVPATPTRNALIKVIDLSSSGLSDVSNNSFIIWQPVIESKTPVAGANTLNFGETNVSLKMNVTTPAQITVNYFEYDTLSQGTLPSGINYLSPYYWTINSTGVINFTEGYISAPAAKLRWVTNPAQVKWLMRADAGSAWVNIGGNLVEGNFISTTPFTSLGEFALGSASPISDVETDKTKEIVVSDYTLFQNYPNPFNPSTKIRYQIPKGSFVSLKVYDVLGREIEELVNEELSAGQYEVDFAPKANSGVYFYRLQAGDFVSTKKMILVK